MKSLTKLIVIVFLVTSGALFASDRYYDRGYSQDRDYNGCSSKRKYYKKSKKHHYKKHQHKKYHSSYYKKKSRTKVARKKHSYKRSHGHDYHHHYHKPYPRIRYDSCYGWTIIF